MTTLPETFEQQKDALAWLHDYFGHPFPSAGKFSQDSRNGNCLVQPNKTYRGKDVKAYAERIKHDRRAASLSQSKAGEREEWEIRKLKVDVEAKERASRKEDRRWMLRSESEDHEAALVGLLRDTLRHRVRIQATSLLRTAGGSPSREPEFMQALLALIDDSFNELADASEIDVEFEEEAFEEEEVEEA